MKEKLLEYLENDARIPHAQLASLLGTTVEEVERLIAECEEEKIILSYRTEIDWQKTEKNSVSALIELKTIPQRDRGFDAVAERISNFPEVRSVNLMSGGFDLALIVECSNMRDVALFVAEKLATIEGVTATATHFVLEKYKENGIIFGGDTTDKRGNSW